MKKIFLAAPFTIYFADRDKADSEESRKAKVLIEKVYSLFESCGYEVQCSHVREKWGKNLWSPDQCTAEDYRSIKEADTLVAFPGNPPSGGTHIEIGWASILGKNIILLLEKDACYSPMIYGLSKITHTDIIIYKTEADLLALLKEKVSGSTAPYKKREEDCNV